MAITNVGYQGTVDEQQWAALSSLLGSDYAVASGLAITAVAGQDRTVAIAPGSAYGRGVLTRSDAQATLQLGAIGSGSRWDAIVLRRNWGTDTSAFAVVPGSSSEQIPAGIQSSPGVLDDQVLALVQVTAGQTAPTAIRDLRAFSAKPITLGSPSAALPADAPIGLQVRRGTEVWARVPDTTGAPTWLLDSPSRRIWESYRQVEGELIAGLQDVHVGNFGDAPRGEYLVTGEYSLSGGADGEGRLQANNTLLTAGQLPRIEDDASLSRRYEHAGGPLTVRLGYVRNATGTKRAQAGCGVRLQWVGPLL